MKKQLLSILLCLIMVVGLLPTAALAEEAAPAFNLATDLAGIEIPDDLVTCICTTTNESKQYGQLTDGFSATEVAKEGNVWTVIIYVENSIYKAEFDKDMGCAHDADGKYLSDFTPPIQFKLKYEGTKWVRHGEMPKNKMLHFTCGGGHVYQGAAPTIALVSRTDTDIKVTENSAWEYSIDDGANWQDSCHFTNLQPGTEYSIIARVKQTATHQPSANSTPLNVTTMHMDISGELKDKLRAVASAYEGEYDSKEHEAVIVDTTNLPTGWTIAGYSTDGGNNFSNDIPKIKDAGTLRVGVKFVHPDYFMNITSYYTAEVTPTTITESDLARLNIPANLVTVKCQKTGDSKEYGRIPGGFDLSKSKPYKDDNGVWKAIVNLNLPAYKAKYDADTGKTHQNEGLGNTSTPAFTLKYVNSKWMIDGNFPAVVLLVTCNGSHENQITFDGNGGRPTNSTMTTTGKKLASLPTATRSGRYSFDGWYTEKNGGTKITTATLFDKDTTVYAHWTYTGSTGGGVTTYPITVKSAKNGDVTASHKSAAKGTSITLTVDPDKGYLLDTLTVLDGKDKEIKLTEKNGKYTFTMPASKVTVAATFKASAPTGKNPFTDVPAGSYYEDAVIWAVDKGITTGTSATTFNPNGICTRAQAVTFLWRAAGSPAAKSAVMPFADVKAGSYYYDAVLWAVEQGITKGTSDTMFSPDATCTRAQIVTFLWRANGSPAVSGNSAFTDVASDAYYAAAVTWAEKNGVTGGIGGGLFGSGNNCTRAQIVTFIYRSVK